MSEKNSESKDPPSGDDIDAEELLATTQANISNELAKKIWSVTSSDAALGIREFPSEKLPYVPSDFGSLLEAPLVSGSEYDNLNGLGSKQLANDNATAHILEVGRALYGETYGFPENDNPNYYKAAENYSLFGEYFLDFPKDTATCFADLEQAPPDGDSKPPLELDRSIRSSLPYDRHPGNPTNGGATAAPAPSAAAAASGYSGSLGPTAPLQPQPQQRQVPRPQPPVPQRQPGDEMSLAQMYQFNQLAQAQAQMNHSHHHSCGHLHGSHVHAQPPVGSAPQLPAATALQQQQQKQLRQGGALLSGAEIAGGVCAHGHVHNHGHNNATVNELNLTQLYQQLMARNMRCNPMQHQHHMVQNQPHHHHTSTCAAAAAAMIYANFEQHIRQLQLQQQIQQQQQQQQQQQRNARIPRGIYGGNGGPGGPGGSGAPSVSGAGAGGVGATPSTNKEPPATGHN